MQKSHKSWRDSKGPMDKTNKTSPNPNRGPRGMMCWPIPQITANKPPYTTDPIQKLVGFKNVPNNAPKIKQKIIQTVGNRRSR